MPESGVFVAFDEGFGNTRLEAWHLHLTREATEDDLEENSNLEEIGESIWTVCVEVSFCPYCGEQLNKESTFQQNNSTSEVTDEAYSDFALFDEEKWSGRLR